MHDPTALHVSTSNLHACPIWSTPPSSDGPYDCRATDRPLHRRRLSDIHHHDGQLKIRSPTHHPSHSHHSTTHHLLQSAPLHVHHQKRVPFDRGTSSEFPPSLLPLLCGTFYSMLREVHNYLLVAHVRKKYFTPSLGQGYNILKTIWRVLHYLPHIDNNWWQCLVNEKVPDFIQSFLKEVFSAWSIRAALQLWVARCFFIWHIDYTPLSISSQWGQSV